MSYAKGYYSIVQYCPDPSRLEAVNIGVALFCPELRFLGASFGRRRTKISQLFGKQDWEFIELQQAAIEARLSRDQESFKTLDDFGAYISRRANALVMTGPRPMKVQSPEQDLKNLLDRLVGSSAKPAEHPSPVSKELGAVLQEAGVVSRLRRDVTVHPPSLPKPKKAPFAYQNGRFNLIEPVRFAGQTPANVFNRASVLAVEGEFVADYKDPQYGDVSLVVVAKFAPDQEIERRTASEVLQKHDVAMYEFGKLEGLIKDILHDTH